VAVVTGGAQGIGLAVAERLRASAPRWCCGTSTPPGLLAKARAQIGAAATTARVELTDEAQVAAAQAVLAAHGRIDILVNNAGITGGNGPTWELDPTCGAAPWTK
jgi:NAD(P)-dependent dehydrogenase (short-subunit alcohol dehydrogenase family)